MARPESSQSEMKFAWPTSLTRTDAACGTFLRIVDIAARVAGFGNAAQAATSELGNTDRGATAAPRVWGLDRGLAVSSGDSSRRA